MKNIANKLKLINGNITRFENMIDGNSEIYDVKEGYATFIWPQEIILELEKPIKKIRLRIKTWDKDGRLYKYQIFISNDKSNWTTIIDRSTEGKSGWDEGENNTEYIKYIKINGIHNTKNKGFHIVQLEVYLNTKRSKHEIGLLKTEQYGILMKKMSNIKAVTNMVNKRTFKEEPYNFLLAQSYANIMTIIEVYLQDIINFSFLVDESYINKFIKSYPIKDISKESLMDIVTNDKSKYDFVKEITDNTIFHRFESINKYYLSVFEIDILKFNECNELFQMRTIRHDIIHRNCIDKSGLKIKMSKKIVFRAIHVGSVFIKNIEKELLIKGHIKLKAPKTQ